MSTLCYDHNVLDTISEKFHPDQDKHYFAFETLPYLGEQFLSRSGKGVLHYDNSFGVQS
jgi:hypothetical protein